MDAPTATRRIGFLAFDGMQGLDLFGPLEAFQEANELSARPTPCYENIVLTPTGAPATTSSRLQIGAHCSLRDCPALDTLVIPGGEGARRAPFPREVLDWITAMDARTRRTGSICTGVFILAQTGVLAGRTVTTHWYHAQEAAQRFADLTVTPDPLFLRDGKYFTAAGVSAGIDLALALIEEDHGSELARQVARHLVVFLQRPGDQRQFSTPLRAQMRARGEFGALAAWIAEHLHEPLDAQRLAQRVHLSERQFRRRFTLAVGETPTRFVERLRVECACRHLAGSQASVEQIARLAGFASPDVLRRTFERCLGVSPTVWRARFGPAAGPQRPPTGGPGVAPDAPDCSVPPASPEPEP